MGLIAGTFAVLFAAMGPRSEPRITVLVYNSGAMPERTLARAQRVASDILSQAGVSLVWRIARAEDAVPSQAEIPLHLLQARPAQLHHDAEGFAVLRRPDAAGDAYAGISLPAVLDTAVSLDAEVPVVLGAALAHEIGHVLLGSGAHSHSGVMSARMSRQEILAAGRGGLRFSAQQASLIRAEAVRRNR
jgi:hypothetical protein